MKAITIRLSQIQEQQIERFANAKRITFTEAVRLAAFSFLDKNEQGEDDKLEHEKTRAKFSDLDNALASQTEDIQTVKAQLNQLGKILGQYIAATSGAQK